MYDTELADGDQANGLSGLVHMLLGQNLLENAGKQKIAQKMNCSVGLYSTDTEQSSTLIFGRDKLIIKNGHVQSMRVVIHANTEHILEVSQVKVIGGLLPVGFFTKRGCRLIMEILKGKLKIKGLITHPITAIRFIALASVA
ncbi:MAG TPA: hypothetical protein DCM26_01785 [Desulfotomaculum sp.]|jgi:hypothetical protein|nr:hypothetical protein [Desulfotomaculum sp.]